MDNYPIFFNAIVLGIVWLANQAPDEVLDVKWDKTLGWGCQRGLIPNDDVPYLLKAH